MKLLVLGATGGIGRALLAEGEARGHAMTAFVRNPSKVEGVAAVKGDPCDEHALAAALPGHDAVLSALGPPGVGKSTIHRDAAKATVSAMKTAGVERLLVVSAAVNFEMGAVAWVLRHTFLANISEDTLAMEAIIRASETRYTIVRPPRLVNGGRKPYAIAEEAMPKGSGVVSRADVAHFMIDEVAANKHVRRMVGMAGG